MNYSTVFQSHNQLESMTCSASAHGFIAKLHDKINPTDFPLQTTTAADKGGFQFYGFLKGIGFKGSDSMYAIEDALDLLCNETQANRYPLVSVCLQPNSPWHIVVAVPTPDGVGLADPARQRLISIDTASTRNVLADTLKNKMERDSIHILTYTYIVVVQK